MTVADKSNCGVYGVDNLIISGVDITICWVADWVTWFELDRLDSCYCEAGENNLDLDSAIIALISSLKLFIIACRALIVTDDSAVAAWFIDILLNNRMI